MNTSAACFGGFVIKCNKKKNQVYLEQIDYCYVHMSPMSANTTQEGLSFTVCVAHDVYICRVFVSILGPHTSQRFMPLVPCCCWLMIDPFCLHGQWWPNG